MAIDQFADLDTRKLCPTIQISDYPFGIPELAREFPPCPFLYVGGLENHPEVVTEIANDRLLLGNGPDVLRKVRDPKTLREALARHQVRLPAIWDGIRNGTSETWLSKPVRSGGGIGIRRVSHSDLPSLARNDSQIVQQFIPGQPVSALFVAACGNASLLGASRQLVGCGWAGADAFHFVGTIAPLLNHAVLNEFIRIGNFLALEFQLEGLFGIDAIWSDGQLWFLEVNPRYTSAVEVLERASDMKSIQLHLDACRNGQLPNEVPQYSGQAHGKAIVYARQPTQILEPFSNWLDEANRRCAEPSITDIPMPGTEIPRGAPVCTVFASGFTDDEVMKKLQQSAARIHRAMTT